MKITEVNSIIPYLKRSVPIGMGSTAICFLMKDNRVFKLYLITYKKFLLFYYNDMKEKLSLLNEVSNESFIGPKEIITVKNEIVGYIYDYKKGHTLKTLSNKTTKDMLINPYLKLINNSDKISEFNIRYYDLHQRNILLSDEYYVIDLDKFYKETCEFCNVKVLNRANINRVILSALFDLKFNEYITFLDNDLNDLLRCANNEDPEAFIDLINELFKDNETKKDVKKYTLINIYEKENINPII